MKSVAESWAEFERNAPASKWTPIQARHMRRGFYAGSLSMVCELADLDAGAVSEEVQAHLDRITEECRDFRHRIVRGEA